MSDTIKNSSWQPSDQDGPHWMPEHTKLHGSKMELDIDQMIQWVAHTIGSDLNDEKVRASLQTQILHQVKTSILKDRDPEEKYIA